MNPYDFVRCDWNKTPTRKEYKPHNSFIGMSGSFEGTITTETPVFLQAKELTQPVPFFNNYAGYPIIPGTSLKGLIRNLVETIAPGCWWFFDKDYRADDVHYGDKLPDEFRRCRDLNYLCPACRMFGMVEGGKHLSGSIGFSDAVCKNPQYHEPIYTRILGTPKPRHSVWYLDKTQTHLAGRKFYFHTDKLATDSERRYSKEAGFALNQYIQPIDVNNQFNFSGHFSNLYSDELEFLLYALVLEPNIRHKLGYAKPLGLGSVYIELTRVIVIDPKKRYTGEDKKTVYEGEGLADFLKDKTGEFVNDKNSITLNDLRRIWTWPPVHQIRYPDRSWFDDRDNAGKPISATP